MTHPDPLLLDNARPEDSAPECYDPLATRISAHARSARDGTSVVLGVTAVHVITLGFDRGEWITPEQLKKALLENFIQKLNDAGDEAFDTVQLLETIDEA